MDREQDRSGRPAGAELARRRLLGVLVLALRRLALALLAAVLVAVVAATLLVGAWLVFDRERA